MSPNLIDVRVRQYEAWGGSAPPEPFPAGDYLQVKRSPGYELTANQALWVVWDAINREAQGLSSVPSALTPLVTKDFLGRAIDAINRCFACVNARIVSRANLMFSDTFGGPATYSYEPYPIRWAGESRQALLTIQDFVSAAFQAIHVRSNLVDNGILEEHGATILHPLFFCKMRIMRDFFGMEIKGSISPNELQAIFRSSNVQPPLSTSFDDLRDLPADLASEDATALGNESAPVPDNQTMTEVTSGVEVWTWVPTLANWATAAEILRRQEDSAPTMAPAEPFPFSTGPIVGAGASTGGIATPSGGLSVPQ